MKRNRQKWYDEEDDFKKPRRFEKDTLDKYKKSVYNLIDEDDDDDYFTEHYSHHDDFDDEE
jgi:hypothetical protein